MKMRRSRVLEKMRDGQVATCVKMNLSDPRVAELSAMCGVDCIWMDMEHVPTDYQMVENIIRAAKAYDTDVLVRVAKGCYSDFLRPFESDAAGIMVPHLMSLEEAKKIVYFTKFHPVGRRPIDGGNADGAYCMVDVRDYMETANKERFVVVQIEDPEPLSELEEICALPGIDMIFFGPADFSQGLGTFCDTSDPRVDETRRLVAKTARRYGKFAGTVGSPATQDTLIEMGYQFINLGADVLSLTAYYSEIVKTCSGKRSVDPNK